MWLQAGAMQRWLEKHVFNPPNRLALRFGISPRAFALLETTGRRSGHPRTTPVGNGLKGSIFWIVSEHGHRCDYVKNLAAEPRVRADRPAMVPGRCHGGRRRRWPGSATPDRQGNGLVGSVDGVIFRASASEPVTIRIDLHQTPPPRSRRRSFA